MIAQNLQEFAKHIKIGLKLVVNDLTAVIYQVLLEFIEVDIYGTYQPSLYQRTYEFRDKAWVRSVAQDLANEVVASIEYDPTKLSVDEETGTHINKEKLAEILNRNSVDGWKDWIWGRTKKIDEDEENTEMNEIGWEYPKPFFDDTLNWINENLHNEVVKLLKKYGFVVIN